MEAHASANISPCNGFETHAPYHDWISKGQVQESVVIIDTSRYSILSETKGTLKSDRITGTKLAIKKFTKKK